VEAVEASFQSTKAIQPKDKLQRSLLRFIPLWFGAMAW